MAWGQPKPVADNLYWCRMDTGWYRAVAWRDNKVIGVYEAARSMDNQSVWITSYQPHGETGFEQLSNGVFYTYRDAKRYCEDHYAGRFDA